jgi:hypothetical protein
MVPGADIAANSPAGSLPFANDPLSGIVPAGCRQVGQPREKKPGHRRLFTELPSTANPIKNSDLCALQMVTFGDNSETTAAPQSTILNSSIDHEILWIRP